MRFGGILSRMGKGTRSFISNRYDRTQLQMESLEERVVLSGTPDYVFGCDEITDQFGNTMAVLSVLPKPVGSSEHGGPCGCSACAAMFAEMAATASASGTTWTSAGAWTSFEASQVFRLHSNPGANHTIYLDFDGHVTTGTPWNNTYGSSIVTEAYDIDGDPSTFSLTELQNIYNIWRRVAEDFAPFNVNVTTQEPSIEMLRRAGSNDTQWGVRVVIGGNGSWFGSAGGVAYINSFSWNTDTPAFVFSRNLSSEKSVAEAITHEVGHTLGLRHHGTSSSAYYSGHGSGETGWAPIMGVGYHRNLTQWSRGDYPGANNSGQDDLAIITNSTNGFGYRTDDVGDTIETASPLTVTGNTVFASGIIERNTDIDVFYFDTGAGTITINANPAPIGPNLDIQLELLDAQGNVIALSNPPDRLSASITLTVAAGRYYVRIQGVGKDTFSTGGYSDYGSLGQYSISGTIVSSTSPPPVSPPPVSPPPVSPPPVVSGFVGRYDFGTSRSPVSSGFVQVTESTRYTSSLGYGWLSGVIFGADRWTGSDLVRDLNYTSEGTFVVDVPSGVYTVTLTLGDSGSFHHDLMGVYLEGQLVDTVSTWAGQVVTRTYTVSVVDGQLTVLLRDLGGTDPHVAIKALEIRGTTAAIAPELVTRDTSPSQVRGADSTLFQDKPTDTWLPGRDVSVENQTVDRLNKSLSQFREKLRFLTEDNDPGWWDALVHLRSRLSLKL